MRFQYYTNDAEQPKPIGFVSLDSFLYGIKSPKEETKQLLEKVAQASQNKDMKLKAELKKQLYAFTPCVHVKEKRKYTDITQFTGLAVLDFDKIENAYEFKEFLFETYSSIIACWISPSKKGIKALIKIPVVSSILEYKSYFYGIASYMQMYKGFDITTQNAVLLLFMSYDKDILIRDNYTEWDIKGIKKNDFDTSKVISIPDIKPTDKQGEWVINWITNKIQSIVDEAHPQLRNACVSLGGYVASGYIEHHNAVSLTDSLITQNGYMQKGIIGYQKTAHQAIIAGISKPLNFN